ncbi:LysE family translocator [Dickeya solani]|uniref:LysE family transporter n=1 Tax=Dickeya solani TaxID=1089444 RepID=A0AAX4F0R9_9GAMM|nr:LysE family transporter [Dickeya solani]MCA7000534.1 LysE family transporter [Dickeya solani]MCZ0823740.1 LysE family transporter [Dickeya solani]MDV6995040.1 LysE family transporter [Dickeya solani]MDV7004513.1 LysE family transporter [Dickeya solani]MDV7037624.1 LysE family transporter [Dickeya solani]
MIHGSEYINVALYIALFLSIPGPTNTLLLCSGYTQGFVKSIKLTLSEWLGYLLAVTAWGLLFNYLSQHGNPVLSVIKFLSAFYVIYLAIKVWNFSLHQTSGKITFSTVFITTLLNPKAFVFADSIIPPSAFIYQNSYIQAMLCLLLALLPISFIWIYFGTLMSLSDASSQHRLKPKLFYRGASLVISLFAASMFYKSVSVMF